ncbi:MAG: DinB family protein [Dehalococcoidia bacterium]
MSDTEALRAALEQSRAELLGALEGVTLEELERRPPGPITDDEARWPIVDVLWHVGDVDDTFRRQVDQAIGGRPISPNVRRARPAHMTTPVLLTEWLAQTRRPTEVLLGRLRDEDLDVEFVRPDGQTRTPRRLLTILEGHDGAHAEQVRALRALATD